MLYSDDDIVVPPLPKGCEWAQGTPIEIRQAIKRGPVLIEFFDWARINCLRTNDYLEAWQARYQDHGLTIITVASSGYSFASELDATRAAASRLKITRPIFFDPQFLLWRDYENTGWPARYLWSKSRLRHWHYGEGEYAETESAIQHELTQAYGHSAPELPELLEPLKPEDLAGTEFLPQSPDIVMPIGIDRLQFDGSWVSALELLGEPNPEDEHAPNPLDARAYDFVEVTKAGTLQTTCQAAEAYAVLSGQPIGAPGLVQMTLVDNPLAKSGTDLANSEAKIASIELPAGTRVHGVQFTPAIA